MHWQGFDLQLTQYDDQGWRATFYTIGMEHSPTSATGTGGSRHRGTRRSGRPGRSATTTPILPALALLVPLTSCRFRPLSTAKLKVGRDPARGLPNTDTSSRCPHA